MIAETLSMKGLILNCLDRKAEAYELVRRGIKVGRSVKVAAIFRLSMYGLWTRGEGFGMGHSTI